DLRLDIVEAISLQACAREFGQRRKPLDREYLGGQPRQYRRTVTRPGADLEHAVAGLDLRRLGHAGHDVRLGNRLPLGDRKRAVLIGEFPEARIDEILAADVAHRFENPLVEDAATG